MAVAGYEILVNNNPPLDLGLVLDTVTEGLDADTLQTFRLRSYDIPGNRSPWSTPVSITTSTTVLFAHYINCGGPASGKYLADDGTIAGTDIFIGLAADWTGVANLPTEANVLSRLRYSYPPPGDIPFSVTVDANKRYKVRVLSAGDSSSSPSTLKINGSTVGTLDPYVDSGNNANHGWGYTYYVAQSASTTMTLEFQGTGGGYPKTVAIDIVEAPLLITNVALPEGTLGEAYTATIVSENADGAETFAVWIGSLPPGLSMDASTGDITGTCTAAGVYTVGIEDTDSYTVPRTAKRIYVINVETAPTSCYLDGAATDFDGIWHVRRMLTSYSGPCLRVCRNSDDAEEDIDFNANDNVDALAFLSFIEGTTVKWIHPYDQSGNGNDLDDMTGASPTLTPNYFNGIRAAFDFGRTPVSDIGMRTSNDLTLTAPKIFAVIDALTSHTGWQTDRSQYVCDFGTNEFHLTIAHGSLYLYNGAPGKCGRFDGGRSSRVTAWYTTGDDKIILNGVDKPASAFLPSGSNTGDTPHTAKLMVGNYGGGGLHQLRGSIGGIIFKDGDLASPADAALIDTANHTIFGDPVTAAIPYSNLLILFGDSRFYAINTTLGVQPDVLSPAVRFEATLPDTWGIIDAAYSGLNIITDLLPRIAELTEFGGIVPNIVVLLMGGINDRFHSPGAYSVADIYNAHKDIITALHAVGIKVAVCTQPASIGYLTSGEQTLYDLDDDALRDDPTHAGADGFVDLRAVLNNPADATYYDDGTHFKVAGAALIADTAEPVITAL